MDTQYLENLSLAIEIIILGMGTVFSSLAFFAFLIWSMTSIDERYNKYKIKKYSILLEKKEVSEEHNDEIIAVISAAIFNALRKEVVIHKIHFLDNSKVTAWASSGRDSLMSSHYVKRN